MELGPIPLGELREFRLQWQRQLDDEANARPAENEPPRDAPADTKRSLAAAPALPPEPPLTRLQRRALDVYDDALELHQCGRVADARNRFRDAFKLDADADVLHARRAQWHAACAAAAEAAAEAARASDVAAFAHAVEALPPVAEWAAQLRSGPRIPMLPLREDEAAHIAKLPDKLLVRVLQRAIVADVAAFPAVSLACKRLAVLARDPAVWKAVCLVHYPHARDAVRAHADSLAAAADTDAATASWMRFFRARARVRLDGAYISRCTYMRTGERAQDAEPGACDPVLEVEYFRALRFARDGTCVALMTTADPARFVRHLGGKGAPFAGMAGYQTGRYELVGDALRVKLTEKARPGMRFSLALKVCANKAMTNRGWRLEWERYELRKDGDAGFVDAIETQHDFKPFGFAKVNSYIR